MCIINALLNVASRKTAKILAERWASSGPHAYGDVHRFLIAGRTTQHLALADASVLAAAAPGKVVLIHCDGHCAGAYVNAYGYWSVADDSYGTWATITADSLHSCVAEAVANGKRVVV